MVDEDIIRVARWLCVKVNRMLSVLHEHEALEADARVAMRILAIVPLSYDPLDESFIVIEGLL